MRFDARFRPCIYYLSSLHIRAESVSDHLHWTLYFNTVADYCTRSWLKRVNHYIIQFFFSVIAAVWLGLAFISERVNVNITTGGHRLLCGKTRRKKGPTEHFHSTSQSVHENIFRF